MRLHNIIPIFEHKEYLIETGLDLKQLRKHGGSYFNTLISKIQNGVALDVEAPAKQQYPDGVIIDPKVVPVLLQAYYPNGDKNNMSTDAGNNVQVVNPAIFKQPIITLNGPPIAFGNIRKSPDFKASSGPNKGNLSEGILGAAVTAKFIKKGEHITMIDIGDIFEGMTPQPIESDKRATSVQGTYVGTIQHDNGVVDNITFILRLNKDDFSPLVISIKDRDALDPAIKGLLRSAIMYVNSEQAGIDTAVKMIVNSANDNIIEVMSDGVSDNTGTKADLKLKINGEVIKLVSLKAGVKQFGQVSGHKFENFNRYINDIFDIDISAHAKKFTTDSGVDAAKHNFDVIKEIYKTDLVPKITKQLEAGPKSEYDFIKKLTEGIVKHATAGDDEIELVKFDSSLIGGFKVLKIDRDTLQEMKKTKFHVQVLPSGSTLKIYGETKNPDLIEKLGTTAPVMLLQLRSNIDSGNGYVRNRLEMGPLLEALTTIAQSIKEPLISKKQLTKIHDLAVGKITKKGERDTRDTKVSDTLALGRAKKK